jgi:hypothetical protein
VNGRRVLTLAVLPAAIAIGALWSIRTNERMADTDQSLVGQWRGPVAFEDSTRLELVIDLADDGSRIGGEFDALDWGVENYPVEAIRNGADVHLRFGGPAAEFDGRLVGGVLIGTVTFQDRALPLSLTRIGPAELSEEYIRLQRAVGDTGRLVLLNPAGTALREAFNRDRDRPRLLMLLAPS